VLRITRQRNMKGYLEVYNELMETKEVFGDMDFWFNASYWGEKGNLFELL